VRAGARPWEHAATPTTRRIVPIFLLKAPSEGAVGEVVLVQQRSAWHIRLVIHHTHVRDVVDPPDRVVHHQLGLDFAPVLDEDERANHRIVPNADVAVDVPHLSEAAPGHAADMSKSLQRRADAVLVLVFRRKVCHRDLHQVPILRKETKIRLLMADKTKLVPAHVNGALLQGNLPRKKE
jgi:hypothetical protein